MITIQQIANMNEEVIDERQVQIFLHERYRKFGISQQLFVLFVILF